VPFVQQLLRLQHLHRLSVWLQQQLLPHRLGLVPLSSRQLHLRLLSSWLPPWQQLHLLAPVPPLQQPLNLLAPSAVQLLRQLLRPHLLGLSAVQPQ